MAGRDAYLEMGFHEPVEPTKVHPNENTPSVERRTFDSGQPLQPATNVTTATAFPATQQKGDYAAGLIVVLLVLMIGFASGFFGRGMFAPIATDTAKLSPMGIQSAIDAEPLPSGWTPDLALFGSDHSDQLLTFAPMGGQEAMMLVKVHVNAAASDAETQLVKLTSSVNGPTFSPQKSVDGSVVSLSSLSDGSLISGRLTNDTLIVERLGSDGTAVWSQNFATSATDPSEISLASSASGIVMLAPSENDSFARIASIKADGFVAWQSSLERPADMTQSLLSVDLDGHIFAVLGSEVAGATPDSTVFLDADGRVLKENIIALTGDDQIAGAVPHAYGGITVFVTGSTPRLELVSPLGERYMTVSLPYMSFSDNAHLLTLESGDLVSTSTVTTTSEGIEVLFEQRSPDGVPLGERVIALPAGSTLDRVIAMEGDEFLLSGSLRSDHYSPTDLFVQRIAFSPSTHPVTLSDPLAQNTATPLAAYTQPVETASTASLDTIDEAAVETELPIIASLSIATEAETDAVIETVAEESSIDVAAAESELLEAAPADAAPEVADSEPQLEAADTLPIEDASQGANEASVIDIDLDAAAMSRFLGQAIVTQCRFTCLEPATGNTFPATGHFTQSQLIRPGDVATVHTRVCQAADLIPQLETAPSCGLN